MVFRLARRAGRGPIGWFLRPLDGWIYYAPFLPYINLIRGADSQHETKEGKEEKKTETLLPGYYPIPLYEDALMYCTT